MSTFTAVPRKGRNAREAMEEKLADSYFSWKKIGDMINGKGKEAAKNGDTRKIEQELEQVGWNGIELAETGREGRRPVLESIKTIGEKLEGYGLSEDPFSGYNEVWMPYDQIAERTLEDQESISSDLGKVARDYADERGYELVNETGSNISWAAMNSDLEQNPSVVLVPEKFENLGEEMAEKYWDNDFEITNYSGNVDEERELAQTPGEVAGIYMYDSGGTAKDFGLEYDQVGDAVSRLGKFQNRFKDNERTFEQEA